MDIFQEVRKLVAKLRAAGFEDYAKEVDDALYGCTGGEIYANLGFNLSQAPQKLAEHVDLIEDAVALLKDIEEAKYESNIQLA